LGAKRGRRLGLAAPARSVSAQSVSQFGACVRHRWPARQIAREALARGFDRQVAEPLQAFFYLPFMHSEALEDQVLCTRLCARPGLENNHKFALEHQEIIERFGRFPHRNAILGRASTPEEIAFLKEPNSSF